MHFCRCAWAIFLLSSGTPFQIRASSGSFWTHFLADSHICQEHNWHLLFREILFFVKFSFLSPTYTGTAILSFTKWYYSPKYYQLYQFIFSSNECIDNFTCYGFVYFKTWLKHKLRQGKHVVTVWIACCSHLARM